MSDKRRPPEPATSRVRSSIARRLRGRLFFRLFGIFVSFDIVICLIAGVSLAVYSESLASRAAGLLAASGPPAADDGWNALLPVTVHTTDGTPRGALLPEPLKELLPLNTAAGTRAFYVQGAADRGLLKNLDTAVYAVGLNDSGTSNELDVRLGPFFTVFRPAMLALMSFQLLVLLTRIGKDSRLVRRSLDPISELTKAAENLNAVSRQLDPDKMAALAGKIAGIDAARLDTRIQVDETQTELKNLARAINGMLDRINDAYRAQVRFVSDASHELRTPIAVIQGYANLLDRWGKNDEKTLQESISAIKEEASNMKELVEQLLFLARGDNNTILLQPERFSLGELIAEVAAETRMIDASHAFETRPGDAEVVADRALIKQALRILVDNAVKYTDAGGTVALSCRTEDGNAYLQVTDTGIGISPENVPHVFDRFYRADESRARATGGAGLGLSIAQWIAAKHGGSVEVLSREGIGTRMSIVLPAAPAGTGGGAEEAPSNAQP